MDEQGEDAAEFRIAEHPIAGPARLFEVALTDGTVAAVQTDPAAQLVHIEIVTATGSPPARLTIGEREAVATASLLAGLRFAVDGPLRGRWRRVRPRSASCPWKTAIRRSVVGPMSSATRTPRWWR